MREWNNGLVIICLLLCICVGLTGYAVQTQFVYDQRDVAVINQLIEENNLNIPKNLPHEWNNGISICWSETYPKRITWLRLEAEQPIGMADLSDLQQLQSLSWHTVTNTLILPKNVKQVSCPFIQLKQLDCSNAEQLKYLQCEGNQLTELDVSNSKKLEEIAVSNNQLTKLTVQDLPKLNRLHCNNNQLTELNLKNLPALELLDCCHNQLDQLQFNNVPKLELVWCYENQLQELDLTSMSSLTNLRCENNQIKQLSVRNLPKLESLTCNHNPLEKLQLENLPLLRSFDCGERGRFYLDETMQVAAFDYATRTVEVSVQPPEGYYLSSCQGLPKDARIDGNTIRFTLPYMEVCLEPFYLSEELRP